MEGTIIFPGFDGGAEWGGSAYDEGSGLLFVNANEMPWILRLVKLGQAGSAGEATGRRTYQAFCGTCHGENRQGDPLRTVPSLDGIESRLSHSAVAALIDSGRGQMPSFKTIPAADRAALSPSSSATCSRAGRRARPTIPPMTWSTPTPATTASSIRRATPRCNRPGAR